ncbi:hypothetical protein MHZ92_10290 [Sporosarcina sp. ACRSL]|uniref:hypothetical protein n=1 Tax=Sporosarcina sp. ACRSL TaxID=2918215 RepID=UPI001EF49320|nr:hypothetical protein [Sporosarcina sp. ACRSL]MCG7344525.1 hypothetical protein [Sporosarcina sp. ACRSL]
MKIRAVLLLALIIGGFYVMLETINDFNEKSFNEFLETMNADFNSLTFNTPPMNGTPAATWNVNDDQRVEELLQFLQNYHVKKLKPEEVDPDDNIDEFTIRLTDPNGNSMTIIVAENLIIQNELLYYEIVDGPLDVDWMVRFFVSTKF